MIRERIYYEGNVQGVGFRASTARIALGFDVAGTVRNLLDGRVELVVEGEDNAVDRFLKAIRADLGHHIHSESVEVVAAGEPFESFRVLW